MTTAPNGIDATRVPWGLVGVFYGIALVGAVVVSLVLRLAGVNLAGAETPLVAQLFIGIVYMPLPLLAGLITDRLAGRHAWRAFVARLRSPRPASVVVVTAAGIVGLGIVNYLVVAVLGNLAGVPGVGRLATSEGQVAANLDTVVPPGVQDVSVPELPVPLLFAGMLLAGLVAGFTINGLLALGEEYGWRGVLADLLAPLGEVRATLLIGVLWGLWHAPLIVLGFNYGPHWASGIALMCLWTVPLSFLLGRARTVTGSVLTPAFIHGGINGMAGFALLLISARDPRLSLPAGVAGALAAAIVAACCWRLWRPRVGRSAAAHGG